MSLSNFCRPFPNSRSSGTLLLNNHKVLLIILARMVFTFKHKVSIFKRTGPSTLGNWKKYQETKLMWSLLPSALQNFLRSCIWPFVPLTSPAALTRILFCPRKLPGVYSILEVHLSLLLNCHFCPWKLSQELAFRR